MLSETETGLLTSLGVVYGLGLLFVFLKEKTFSKQEQNTLGVSDIKSDKKQKKEVRFNQRVQVRHYVPLNNISTPTPTRKFSLSSVGKKDARSQRQIEQRKKIEDSFFKHFSCFVGKYHYFLTFENWEKNQQRYKIFKNLEVRSLLGAYLTVLRIDPKQVDKYETKRDLSKLEEESINEKIPKNSSDQLTIITLILFLWIWSNEKLKKYFLQFCLFYSKYELKTNDFIRKLGQIQDCKSSESVIPRKILALSFLILFQLVHDKDGIEKSNQIYDELKEKNKEFWSSWSSRPPQRKSSSSQQSTSQTQEPETIHDFFKKYFEVYLKD